MYYKLNSKYCLRGWEKLNTGVVDDQGAVGFLPQNVYKVLLKATGQWDSKSLFFSEAERKLLQQLAKAGILDGSNEPNGVITEAQQYKSYPNRFIRSVHWSLTGRCNYRCRHCYMGAPHGRLGELSLEQCKSIVDSFVRCGIFQVSLTGGEALVHPHFWDIVAYLLDNHIHITQIYSNGYLINESFFAKCAQLGIKPEIALSFDGTDGQHAWLRNIPDALKHLQNALVLCNKYNFSTFVEYCMHKGNAHCLRDSINFLESYHVGSFKMSRLLAKGDGATLAELAITPAELWQVVLDYLPYYKQDAPEMFIMLEGFILRKGKYRIASCKNLTQEQLENYYTCAHARNYMHIAADGKALPCLPITNVDSLAQKFPNVIEYGLERVLTDSVYIDAISTSIKDYLKHNQACKSCPHLLKCAGGCRAINAVDDLFAKDVDTCWFYQQEIDDKLIKACQKLKLEQL